jgi:two-component system nitrogen regulation response regulator GlnG
MSARILLADDDASLRFVLSQALGKEGYNVRATGQCRDTCEMGARGRGRSRSERRLYGRRMRIRCLPSMRMTRPQLPFIVMSAQSTVVDRALGGRRWRIRLCAEAV